MDYILIVMVAILFVSGLNIVCFFIGAKVGQKVVRGEEVEIPNPVKAVKESVEAYKEDKEAIKEREYYEAIAHNIDVYDGTSIGQMEIPR